ncbi:MAG TPA: CoA pyrophosphatase [Candidatus Tumulicola sp.]|jgi:8-oxo-dGTP pyrophosphatase MutT (NUDIX family)
MLGPRRRAAVVIAIFRTPPHGIVFVERAAHLRDHPGQIGLPGGGVHPEDSGLPATALRELHEEVGVEAARVTIVDELPVIRQRIANNFDVTPFIAIVEPGELRIDATETAGVFVVPLARVLEFAKHEDAIDFEGRRIWGLTARILHEFVERWNAGGEARVRTHLSDHDDDGDGDGDGGDDDGGQSLSNV